jgi:acyl dehydratase
MGFNRSLIGKQYPSISASLAPQEACAFAAAIDDTNFAYATAALAPPMVVAMFSVPYGVLQVLQDPALCDPTWRLARLLHYAEDIRWWAPLRLAQQWVTTAMVEAVDDHGLGEILRVRTHLRASTGELLAEVGSSLFLRERKPRGAQRPVRVRTGTPALIPAWESRWCVAADQADRYAKASHDPNPIHLDDAAARQVGLKQRVLHGLCTLAFAQRAVGYHMKFGSPQQLRRLQARFVRPVYMGDVLTCEGTEKAVQQGTWATSFVVKNQHGQVVLAEGAATWEL